MVGKPDGWMLHVNEPPGTQFSMYPVFETFETAMHRTLFLYGVIILKSEHEPTMEAIAERHERETRLRVPSVTFERLDPLEGSSMIPGDYPRSLLRRGNLVDLSGPEFSLYIDSTMGVLLLNLLYPPAEESVSLDVLKWIGSTAVMMTRQDEVAPTAPQSI